MGRPRETQSNCSKSSGASRNVRKESQGQDGRGLGRRIRTLGLTWLDTRFSKTLIVRGEVNDALSHRRHPHHHHFNSVEPRGFGHHQCKSVVAAAATECRASWADQVVPNLRPRALYTSGCVHARPPTDMVGHREGLKTRLPTRTPKSCHRPSMDSTPAFPPGQAPRYHCTATPPSRTGAHDHGLPTPPRSAKAPCGTGQGTTRSKEMHAGKGRPPARNRSTRQRDYYHTHEQQPCGTPRPPQTARPTSRKEHTGLPACRNRQPRGCALRPSSGPRRHHRHRLLSEPGSLQQQEGRRLWTPWLACRPRLT